MTDGRPLEAGRRRPVDPVGRQRTRGVITGSCDAQRERGAPNIVTWYRASRLSELLKISLPYLTRQDTALEAFRHNPTDGSFAPPPARASA